MRKESVPTLLKVLWQQRFFQKEQSFDDITKKLNAVGCNPTPQTLNAALSRAKFLTRRGKRGHYRYIQKHAPHGVTVGVDILPDELIKVLSKDFRTEIGDLRHNFGTSGTCTAFLLRKILEKLVFLAFAKNMLEGKLQNTANNRLVGLQTMLTLATSCKVNGKPFLMQKTADAIQGVKFLGDSAAHNPLANVSMKTIEHTMPFIITAYSELSGKL